jgi:IS5 family transposase
MKRQSLNTVIVDTTVQPTAIAHPTDSRLLNREREPLVAAAQEAGCPVPPDSAEGNPTR